MNDAPIFVVGVQRSGTTLLAAMLGAHSRLSCGPETHFFRRLAKTETAPLCRPETWPDRAVDFVASIRHSAFPGCEARTLLEKYGVDEGQVREYLEGREPNIGNILGSVTESFMRRNGKERWIEKTPDHIENLEAIRRSFPDSPIIRIVRDPRDVALSLMKVPWGTTSLLEGLLFWLEREDVGEAFLRTDPRSYLLRFEDLVSQPEETMRRLCAFLGEPYEAGMLDTSTAGRKLNSRNAPWKAKASQALDPGRIAAWRKVVSADDNLLAEAILGDRLDRHGYPRGEVFPRLGEIYPGTRVAAKFAAGLIPVVETGVRFWSVSKNEKATVQVFVGEPENASWFAAGGVRKVFATLGLSIRIVKAILPNHFVYWIADTTAGDKTGFCSAWLRRLLGPYKVELAVSPSVRQACAGGGDA